MNRKTNLLLLWEPTMSLPPSMSSNLQINQAPPPTNSMSKINKIQASVSKIHVFIAHSHHTNITTHTPLAETSVPLFPPSAEEAKEATKIETHRRWHDNRENTKMKAPIEVEVCG